jgi:hypothetical protein
LLAERAMSVVGQLPIVLDIGMWLRSWSLFPRVVFPVEYMAAALVVCVVEREGGGVL